MSCPGIRILLLLIVFLAACAGPPPAPVEDRSSRSGSYALTPDGYYRVRRGDSLHAIAFKFGLDWRSIAKWNEISSPYVIHPDQALRLSPPSSQRLETNKSSSSTPGVSTAAAPPPSKTVTRSVDTPRSSTSTVNEPGRTSVKPADTGQVAESDSRKTKAPAGSTYTTPAGDPSRWLWPVDGRLLSTFRANDPTRKGIDISGKVGQNVVASASGQVVYSGNGLLGYGELIIIKHSERMLSAYAHNSKRMVNEGAQVKAGSKIAEMGTNDRNQTVLHFEIRVVGTPEDPLKYLPRK
jgi:lipoprotein NlpD